MSGRRWCPSAWIDEVCLVLVAHPADALHRGDDGRWFLSSDDDCGDPDAETIPLEPGQVVAWQYTEPRGQFVVTKREDGRYVVEGGEIPADATHWWLPGDPDTLADSLDELVAESMEPGTETVGAYFWSEDVPLLFEIVDGAGRFLPPQSAGMH